MPPDPPAAPAAANAPAVARLSFWDIVALLLENIPLVGKSMAAVIRNPEARRKVPWVAAALTFVLVLYPFIALLAVTHLLRSSLMPEGARVYMAEQVREAFRTDEFGKASNTRLDYFHVFEFHGALQEPQPVRLRVQPYQRVALQPIQALVTSTNDVECPLPAEALKHKILTIRANETAIRSIKRNGLAVQRQEISLAQWQEIEPTMDQQADLELSIERAQGLPAELAARLDCPFIVVDVKLGVEVFKDFVPRPAVALATGGAR